MHRVLVTGGAGYIGSHCCQALARAGFQPLVFDNLNTGHESFVRWGPFIHGDMRDPAALQAAMRQADPVAVIHFAALSLVGESTAQPARYWENNVGGTLNLLNAMREAAVPNLVFSSTCAVYGEPSKVPLDETLPRQPINPYGATKHACERMMEDFDAAHGLRSVRLRYFNAAGADPGGEIGEWHEPETHLLPLVLDAAAGIRPEIQVFGTDYPTPDGTAVRDYIHVADLASAHVAALKHLLGAGASASLESGHRHRHVGAGSRRHGGGRDGADGAGQAHAAPCRRSGGAAGGPGKAQALLGWRAEQGLKAIVEDAWRWHGKLAAFAGADKSRSAVSRA